MTKIKSEVRELEYMGCTQCGDVVYRCDTCDWEFDLGDVVYCADNGELHICERCGVANNN